MLYKNVFVPGVNSYIYILISSLILYDVILKWGYCTSHYIRGIPVCINQQELLKPLNFSKLKVLHGPDFH